MSAAATSATGVEAVISELNTVAETVDIETLTVDEIAPILAKLSGGGRNLLLALANAIDQQPLAAAARRAMSFGRHSYLRKTDEVVAARKVKYIDAVRIVRREHPALFITRSSIQLTLNSPFVPINTRSHSCRVSSIVCSP